ncbi:hypothetical protein evm_015336 [Chilo suppressalis]|nr:hypothetical protein evm_015336 [Chilo suppressalis]
MNIGENENKIHSLLSHENIYKNVNYNPTAKADLMLTHKRMRLSFRRTIGPLVSQIDSPTYVAQHVVKENIEITFLSMAEVRQPNNKDDVEVEESLCQASTSKGILNESNVKPRVHGLQIIQKRLFHKN